MRPPPTARLLRRTSRRPPLQPALAAKARRLLTELLQRGRLSADEMQALMKQLGL